MMRSQSTLLAVLVLVATTTTALAITGTSRIAGYQTKSTVTGSKIDLDQAELERHLALGDFERAKEVYRKGAHMEPYAILQLDAPLLVLQSTTNSHNSEEEDELHHQVIGMNTNGQAVYGQVGKLQTQSGGPVTTLYVNYEEDENRKSGLECAVGGHVDPIVEGCLVEQGGLILSGHGAVNYHYDAQKDNRFWSTLWGFSEHEAEKMFHCKDQCPYPEYEKFYQYYGQLDYGVIWINAALEGISTNHHDDTTNLDHGNQDFALLNEKGRAAAIQTATVTMNVFTQINRIMTEWSMDRCHNHCTPTNTKTKTNDFCPEASEPWDMAVATYAGSLVGPDGDGEGRLLYSLADELCQDFATCGTQKHGVEGTSGVNLDIIAQFQSGRTLLESGNCMDARLVYGKVVHLMTVPLIQGILRSTHRLQYTHQRDDQERGKAAAFVASILPDLHSCSHMDATIVYNELSLANTRAGVPNFHDVKEALERNYMCMSVLCEDVGGLYNANLDEYAVGAEPCGQRRASKHSSRRSPETRFGLSGFLLGNVAIFAMLFLATFYRQRWVPAVSSRADILLSAGAAQFQSPNDNQQTGNGRSYNSPALELQEDLAYHPIPQEQESPVELA